MNEPITGERASAGDNPRNEKRLDEYLQIERWPISRLRPYRRSLRKNAHAVDRMVASIQQFGFKIPILARTSGEIVDGHLRLKAAQKLGMDEVVVILCDEWSEEQVKAFRLMVNECHNWALWDLKLVALEVQELKAMNFDLALTGFAPVEIDKLLFAGDPEFLSPEQIPEMPSEAVSQLGDRWRCDEHVILCGDATSQEAVQLLLGGSQPRLMVTDPPYGVAYDPSWRERAGLGRPRQVGTIR